MNVGCIQTDFDAPLLAVHLGVGSTKPNELPKNFACCAISLFLELFLILPSRGVQPGCWFYHPRQPISQRRFCSRLPGTGRRRRTLFFFPASLRIAVAYGAQSSRKSNTSELSSCRRRAAPRKSSGQARGNPDGVDAKREGRRGRDDKRRVEWTRRIAQRARASRKRHVLVGHGHRSWVLAGLDASLVLFCDRAHGSQTGSVTPSFLFLPATSRTEESSEMDGPDMEN